MTNCYSVFGRAAAVGAMLMGSVFAASALEPITVASVNPPADAVVNQISQIFLQLDNEYEGGALWTRGAKAVVKDAEGNEVATGTGGDSQSGFKLVMKPAVTEAGTYTVEVPAGSIYAVDWDTFETIEESKNEAFSLTYTVEPMDQVVIESTSPASGSSVKALNSINVTLSGGNPVYGIMWKSGDKAEITNQDGEVMSEYATIRNMPTGYVLKVSKKITTPGTYSITVPAGALYAINGDYQTVYGTENKKTVLRYTVVECEAPAFESATPEDGATVSRLAQIVTYWSNVDAEVGFDVAVESVEVMDADGNAVAVAAVERNFATCLLTLDKPVETAGTYSLTLPKNMIYALDAEGNRVVDCGSAEQTLTYTVDPAVGVEDAFASGRSVRVANGVVAVTGFEAPVVEVYDAAGTPVAGVLQPGFYIIRVSDASGSLVERVVVK